MIKTFRDSDPVDLDDQVNAWLEANQGEIEIVSEQFAMSNQTGGDIRIVRPVYGCMVTYRRKQQAIHNTGEHKVFGACVCD